MDAAHLHLELLECGEYLIQALAEGRKASRVGRNSRLARQRLRRAHWEVERAAEYYAHALKAFRVELLSEFVPGHAPDLGLRDRETKAPITPHRGSRGAGSPKTGCRSLLPRRHSNFNY
jgi:hypothetical protein